MSNACSPLSPRLCPLLQPNPLWDASVSGAFRHSTFTHPKPRLFCSFSLAPHRTLPFSAHSSCCTPRSPPRQEPLPAHVTPAIPHPAHPAELPVPSLGYLEYLSLLPPLSLSTSLFSLDDCPPSNSAPCFHSCPPPIHSTQQPEWSPNNGYQLALAFRWLLIALRDPHSLA